MGDQRNGRYLSPGVYLQEVASAAKPIEAVGTAVAAFVGLAPLRPARAAAAVLLVVAVVWTARRRMG
jgi:phage tail sheath protein FI